MKKLFLLLLLTCTAYKLTFATQSNDAIDTVITNENYTSQSETPTLIITSIINRTPYHLILCDRFNNICLDIPAEYGSKFSYVIENYKNVVNYGSMKECMASSAQFVLEPINLPATMTNAQSYYLNFCIVPGGINDGSNITSGVIGSMVSKFFRAGSDFGCSIQISPLKKFKSNEIEIFLEFYIDRSDSRNNTFCISTACSFVTDKSIENPIDVTHKRNAAIDAAPLSMHSILVMSCMACIAYYIGSTAVNILGEEA